MSWKAVLIIALAYFGLRLAAIAVFPTSWLFFGGWVSGVTVYAFYTAILEHRS